MARLPDYPVPVPANNRYVVRRDDDTLAKGVAGALSDVALNGLVLNDKGFRAQLLQRVTDARLSRTIYGASVLEITVHDWDRNILNSRFVKAHSQVNIDGHHFTLVGIKKTGNYLRLVFEDRAIARLRLKKGAKKARRGSLTRAQFAERLVKEVPGLLFYSPEKNVVQEVEPSEVLMDGTSGGNPAAGTSGGGTRQDWVTDFFLDSRLMIPNERRTMDAAMAWIAAEGGTARWNPLNTSLYRPGATDYNHIPVRNYPSRAVGIDANASTLHQPDMAHILDAFKDPTKSSYDICTRIDTGPVGGNGRPAWGTEHSRSALQTVQGARAESHGKLVTGAGSAVPGTLGAGIAPMFVPTDPAPSTPNYPSPTGQPDGTNPTNPQKPVIDHGFPREVEFSIDGIPANRTQEDNTETAINQGRRMHVRRDLMVAAVCAGFTRTRMTYKPGDVLDERYDDNMGILQLPTSLWPEGNPRDIKSSFKMFYTRARRVLQRIEQAPRPELRSIEMWELCQEVIPGPYDTHGAFYAHDYQKFYDEAKIAVDLFFSGDDVDGDGIVDEPDPADEPKQYLPYEFSRGTEDNPNEDSWTCLTPLAEEVNWRCFVVDSTVFFVRDARLLKNRVADNIMEYQEGVDDINFDYDTGKPTAEVRINCRATRWGVPPGSTIRLEKLGPATGKYIVSDITRSLFSAGTEITLVKPEPQLKEPAATQTQPGGLTDAGGGAGTDASFEELAHYMGSGGGGKVTFNSTAHANDFYHGADIMVLNGQKQTMWMDENLMRLVALILDEYPNINSLQINSARSTHSVGPNGAPQGVSNHKRGGCTDLGAFNGMNVNSGNLVAKRVYDELVASRSDLEKASGHILEIVSPWNNDGHHGDHIHAGFRNNRNPYLSSAPRWSGPK